MKPAFNRAPAFIYGMQSFESLRRIITKIQMKIKESINVGHTPIKLSSSLCFFVKHGGNISAKLRQESYRNGNLELGGLEDPTLYCLHGLHVLLFADDILSERTTHDKTKTTYKQIKRCREILATLVGQ